jgi:sec-independent protein translocase protein TatA
MNLGAPEMLIVFAVVVLLFGSSKLPGLARGLGEARREFERGSTDGATGSVVPATVPVDRPR